MKILHVVQGYTPSIGGTEFFIQKLSEHLVKRHGDDVTVFTTTAAKNCEIFWLKDQPSLPPGVEMINGVTVRRFPIFNKLGRLRHLMTKVADFGGLPFKDWFRAFFNGPLIFNMTGEIARFQADVITASSFPFLHMNYALTGGRRSNSPVLLCGALHTTDSWSFERPMIYKAINQAQAYVAHSRFEREYLIKRGVPASKISAIGVGIDIEQFANADGLKLRADYGWGKAPVILFTGALSTRKGLPHLLDIMPKVWEKYPEVKLLLAGVENSYLTQLKQGVAKLTDGYPNRVVIKSNFSEAEKADIFAVCDLFVFPSTKESFGIVLLEAWACRKAVIGMRAGAIPTIIDDGIDGLLADPQYKDDLARAIAELLANPEQRTQMGLAGYRKVKDNYTWDIVTDKFRQLYEAVIDEHEKG